MNELLLRLSQPVSMEGQNVSVTASVWNQSLSKGWLGRQRLWCAPRRDTALYYAKANGKNIIVNFGIEMDVALSRRFGLLTVLRSAIERDEFVLVPLPANHESADWGRCCCRGAGVLEPSSVWHDWPLIVYFARRGIRPDLEAVGEWVLDEALAQYSMWEPQGVAATWLWRSMFPGFQVRRLETIEQKIRTAIAARR